MGAANCCSVPGSTGPYTLSSCRIRSYDINAPISRHFHTSDEATARQRPPGARKKPSEVKQEPLGLTQEALAKQEEPPSPLIEDSAKAGDPANKQPGPVVPDLTLAAEGFPPQGPKDDTAAIGAAVEASAESLKKEIQPQVDALWDAVKWVEDRMELIDADRTRELEDASRTAAENTAKVSVRKDVAIWGVCGFIAKRYVCCSCSM